MAAKQNYPSASKPGQMVCACGRGYASAHDNRCGYCRDAEAKKLKRRRKPYAHLYQRRGSSE